MYLIVADMQIDCHWTALSFSCCVHIDGHGRFRVVSHARQSLQKKQGTVSWEAFAWLLG